MIGLAIFVLLVATAVYLGRRAATSSDSDTAFGFGACTVGLAVPILIMFVACWIVPVVAHVNNEADIDRYEADIEVYSEREVELEAVIREGLTGYPEIEREIIDGIDPEIILSYPNLRAPDVLIEKVNQLVAVRDAKFNAELERNAMIAANRAAENNPFVVLWGS